MSASLFGVALVLLGSREALGQEGSPEPRSGFHAEIPLLRARSRLASTRLADPRQVPVAATVIDSTQAAASPFLFPEGLLMGVAGVPVNNRSESGTVSQTRMDVAMRGVKERQTLVLADGIPLNDPFGGWVLFNKIPKSAVQSVEVLRAGGLLPYGSLGGGVIQFRTYEPGVTRRVLQADYGERDSRHVSLYASQPAREDLDLVFFADYLDTDGPNIVPEDRRGPVDQPWPFLTRHIGARAFWEPGARTKLSWAGQYYNDFKLKGTALAFERMSSGDGYFGVEHETEGGSRLEARLHGGRQVFKIQNTSIKPGPGAKSDERVFELPSFNFYMPADQVGGSFLWWTPLGSRHGLTAGFSSSHIGLRDAVDKFNSAGNFAGTDFDEGAHQVLFSPFAEWVFAPAERWTASLGIRGDLWWNFGASSWTVFPSGAQTPVFEYPGRNHAGLSFSAGLNHQLRDNLGLRGAAYSGYRPPNGTELHQQFLTLGRLVIPNPDLIGERSLGGELGADWTPQESLRVSITGFYNKLYDSIVLKNISATEFQKRNLDESHAYGSELEARWKAYPRLELAATYALNYAQIQKSPESPQNEGNRLPGIPLHQGSLWANWQAPMDFWIFLQFRSETKRFENESNTLDIQGFGALDGSIRKRVGFIEYFLAATNILDKQIYARKTEGFSGITHFLAPPRTVSGGVRLHF